MVLQPGAPAPASLSHLVQTKPVVVVLVCSDLLQLADLVVEVIDPALVLQAELGQEVGAQLGLQ